MSIFLIITFILEGISIVMLSLNSILCRFIGNGNKTAVCIAERASAWLAFVFATAAAVAFVGGVIILNI